jgi:hypothetical protein
MAAGEFEAIVIPGNHLTIVDEPNVRLLAARLNERLPHLQLRQQPGHSARPLPTSELAQNNV